MKVVFADTSYWIALLNPKDNHHSRALALSKTLGKSSIVTSELVLTELLNAFARFGPRVRKAACDLVDEIHANTEVVPMTTAGFAKAVELYRSRLDKKWSLTDCASFQIMESMSISEALSTDADFAQAGFQALLAQRIG